MTHPRTVSELRNFVISLYWSGTLAPFGRSLRANLRLARFYSISRNREGLDPSGRSSFFSFFKKKTNRSIRSLLLAAKLAGHSTGCCASSSRRIGLLRRFLCASRAESRLAYGELCLAALSRQTCLKADPCKPIQARSGDLGLDLDRPP